MDHTSPFELLLSQDAGPAPAQTFLPNTVVSPAVPQTVPANIFEAPHQFGTPDQDETVWQGRQQHQDSCAIVSQEYIINQFTGEQVTEGQLVQEAQMHGWYTPGQGTTLPDVGNLLEEHGVPVNRFEHASIFNLANELAEGHKVIIGVDSAELWNAYDANLPDAHRPADHALVVSGIDTSDPAHVMVRVDDPGTGEARSYPMEQFVKAWEGSHFFMVSTQQPTPPHAPEMVHFDYTSGHIPEVAGIQYDHFVTLEDNPQSIHDLFDAYTPAHGAFFDPSDHTDYSPITQDAHIHHVTFEMSVDIDPHALQSIHHGSVHEKEPLHDAVHIQDLHIQPNTDGTLHVELVADADLSRTAESHFQETTSSEEGSHYQGG